MKNILFVDDELLVLEGLKRMLRPLRGEWEMVFVENGVRALEELGKADFDIVVSDMRMPGMNGAELLAEVMKRSPKSIRLILSGHADQQLVWDSIGSTHQYLSKPCTAEDLKCALARAVQLENSLQNHPIRELVARMSHVPSLPSLYTQVLQAAKDPDICLEEIGSIVSQDIGMTAKLLQLVNGAFLGLRREITSPAEAVGFVGLETLKALILSIHVFSEFSVNHSRKFSPSQLWRHCQATAVAAKTICGLEQAQRKLVEESFVAGLLHDIGKLVLASNFPDDYDSVIDLSRKRSISAFAAESQVFQANHAQIGAYLLGLWGLPVPVVEAIAFHHSPNDSQLSGFGPLTAVYAANRIVNIIDRTDGATPGEPDSYLAGLQLEPRFAEWSEAIRGASLS
jgi:putative nucleotidyltransferase with HDIG domain